MRYRPFFDKKLARLGDSLVNFIVSAALTLVKGEPVGIKVSDKVLNDVYRKSYLEGRLKLPKGLYGADVVEAFFGYAWLNDVVDTRWAIEVLVEDLKKNESIEEALAMLVNKILEKLGKKTFISF